MTKLIHNFYIWRVDRTAEIQFRCCVQFTYHFEGKGLTIKPWRKIKEFSKRITRRNQNSFSLIFLPLHYFLVNQPQVMDRRNNNNNDNRFARPNNNNNNNRDSYRPAPQPKVDREKVCLFLEYSSLLYLIPFLLSFLSLH